MRHTKSSPDRERSEVERAAGGPGLVNALRDQLKKRRVPDEISFDHDEYVGRNVLSITVRDENDVDEIPLYYEQAIFTRLRGNRHEGEPDT